ncbi:hypothetical protein DLM76_18535 [Leptospira yasudae]|uniref:hypothetical protein n=1 Tax=Leptospira yasudae TaxID=2202201 RepID=UPI000E59B3DA|nr:hypothetical protein [Leptospira yasudae]RHX91160.1 hypothetical protein DLM76_18535 [Leptospira yasudae]
MEKNVSQSSSDRLNIFDDSISLTQIIKTIIVRRNWFYVIFLFCSLVFSLIAFSKRPVEKANEQTFKFTTYLFVGSYLGDNAPIESFYSIEFAIREIYSKNANPNYPLEIENDPMKTGNIIAISTIAQSEEEEKITEFHKQIVLPILERHAKLFADSENNSKTVGGEYLTKFSGLSTSILKYAQKVRYEPAPNRIWIRILQIGFFVSFLLACIGIFVLEYVLQIKRALAEELN